MMLSNTPAQHTIRFGSNVLLLSFASPCLSKVSYYALKSNLTRQYLISMALPPTDMSSVENLETSNFDFVIIGGGTAGLVVAARLTENPDIKVLVLEAGADRRQDPRIKIQGLCLSTYFDPDFDWCLSTEPQPGLNNRRLGQP